jgi:hypothetical protein
MDDKNIVHNFDLSKGIPGDWFLGCKKCWFQHDIRVATVSICPNCRNKMKIFYITADDFIKR